MKRGKFLLTTLIIVILIIGPKILIEASELDSLKEKEARHGIGISAGFGGYGYAYRYYINPSDMVQATAGVVVFSDEGADYSLGLIYNRIIHQHDNLSISFGPGVLGQQNK